MGWFSHQAIGVGAILVGLLICATVLTNAEYEFTKPDAAYTTYYDALGDSMLDGRFDVPREAIGWEAFLLHGRTYGYFGPTPAILRIPLNRTFEGMRGRWTRLSMLAAIVLTLVATHSVAGKAARFAHRAGEKTMPSLLEQYVQSAFVLMALLGTHMLSMMRLPMLYHEAAAWGVACSMSTYALLLRYQEGGRASVLFCAVSCAIAAFQARGSVGVGAMAAVWLLVFFLLLASLLQGADETDPASLRSKLHRWILTFLPKIPGSRLARHAMAFAIVLGMMTGVVLYKNHVVFGNFSGAPPLHLNVQIIGKPERLARTDGGNFVQVGNLRTTLYNYFVPTNFHYGPPFPFFRAINPHELRRFPETKLDYAGPFASVTGVNTFWCVVTLLGVVFVAMAVAGGSAWPRVALFAPALAGAAAGAGSIFIVACLTQRYLYDLYPLFVIGGSVGFYGLLDFHRRSTLVRTVFPVVVLIALYTCFANGAVAMGPL